LGRLRLTTQQINRGRRLAERIQAGRRRRGFTQEQLAQMAGISVETLKKVEKGVVTSPSVFLIHDLAEVLREDVRRWLT
jgi:transcriptional regulator with XRE-family HTH domain